MTQPTCGDLFCGCGGAGLGLQQAGFRHLWAYDADAHCVDSFNRNVAPVAVCRNIESVDWAGVPPVDFLWGSPPCQGFSVAGKRAKDDPRNGLVWGFVWAVAVLRPRAFAMENVPGIGQGHWAQFPQWVRGALETLGYKVTVMKLNAADYGVPQIRRRVFWVGARASFVQVPPPTHAEHAWNGLLPWVTVRQALGIPYERPSPRVTCSEGRGVHPSDITNRRGARRAGSITLLVDAPAVGGALTEGWLTAPGHHRSQTEARVGVFKDNDCPSRPVVSGHSRGWVSGQNGRKASGQYRRLTVEECLILQGFPPGFEVAGNQSQRYSQVGNAVPPALGRAIGVEVRKYLV